jgi:hypothetical protein
VEGMLLKIWGQGIVMYGFVAGMILCSYMDCKSNSKKSPASGTGNVSESGRMSHWGSAQSRVCMDQCVSTIRAVERPVFVCLCSSCYHVTGRRAIQLVRLMLQVVMQNDRDCVDVILV